MVAEATGTMDLMDLSGDVAETSLGGDAPPDGPEPAARSPGATLETRALQRDIGNHLTLAACYSQLLLASPDLPPHLRVYAQKAFHGAVAAVQALRQPRLSDAG